MISSTPSKRDKKTKKSKDLMSLDEVRRRLLLFREEYRGISAIPVDAIVGSDDRHAQFTRKFKPRLPGQRERMRQLELAFPRGDFPPIKVYRVGDSYFVRDGHIRVATAKQMGIEFIDAEVTVLETDATLAPDSEIIDVIHQEQHRRLLAETELADTRPDADLQVSRLSGYARLRESIAGHGFRLMRERDALLSRREVAEDWYDQIYRPSIEALRSAELVAEFANSTEADLFLWLERRRHAMLPNQRAASLEDAARQAAVDDPGKRSETLEEEAP